MSTVSMAEWKDGLWAELFDDASGDGRPVSIIHIDDALFSRACARQGLALSDTEAKRAFLGAFPDRLRVQRWLTGSEHPGEALLPLLILCCLAASEAADSDDNDYRGRMRDLMSWHDRIINCAALPRLWSRLASLTVKHAERTPTRPLVLPDPRFRRQIGHAIELTFPSRNDARRLMQELSGETFDLDAPRAVLAWLAPLVARGRFSPTFEEAFNGFRDAWLAAERALSDHRFWSGWKLATQNLNSEAASIPFEIVSDEWGLRHLIDPATEEPVDLEAGLRGRTFPAGLVTGAIRGHVIPLVEAEWGRLRWHAGERAKAASAALIRQRAFGSRYAALNCISVSGADGWGVTFDVARVFGERTAEPDRDRLIDAVVTGCTRVDGGILARPTLPFLIETSGYIADVALTGEVADQLTLEKVNAGTWRVTPLAPINADIRIIAEPRAGGASFERGLRLRRSILVPSFRDPPPERLFDADPGPGFGWPYRNSADNGRRQPSFSGEKQAAPGLLDLIEYLSIRTGPLPLGGFLELAQSAIGADGINPWDVVQALRDAGIVKILEVRGWRGRVILSRAPRGAIVRTYDGWALTFEGCLSETWVERTMASADHLGLKVEIRPGVGSWSPPTLTVSAQETSPLRELAESVETPVGYLAAGLAMVATLYTGSPIARAHAGVPRRDIRLTGRHAPLAFLDSDQANAAPLWEVRHGTGMRFWKSRDDAVLDAYTSVRERPFSLVDGRMVAESARLPSHVARWVRLALGVTAGPFGNGYGYARDAALDRELARIAPALFARQVTMDPRPIAPIARQWAMRAVAAPGGPQTRAIWDAARETWGRQ